MLTLDFIQNLTSASHFGLPFQTTCAPDVSGSPAASLDTPTRSRIHWHACLAINNLVESVFRSG